MYIICCGSIYPCNTYVFGIFLCPGVWKTNHYLLLSCVMNRTLCHWGTQSHISCQQTIQLICEQLVSLLAAYMFMLSSQGIIHFAAFSHPISN